jgi:endoglucanase
MKRKLSYFITMLFIWGIHPFIKAQSLPAASYIRIDQFGYLPNEKKVAVIAKSTAGFNNGAGIDLNTGVNVELRRVNDNVVVFSAAATAWNAGNADADAGDKGWWFDFTSYTTAGEYYIRCTKTGGATQDSYRFKINNNVYSDVLKAAMQFFYYQRINQDKTSAFAQGTNWIDTKWYTQDASEKDVNGANPRDLSGGWIDAGDPNKYTDFALTAVHNLLTTYENYPTFWNSFNLNIPESSNSTPDILDEVKWEIDWLRKMQLSNGAFTMKMGIKDDDNFNTNGGDQLPSADTRTRYYSVTCPHSTIIGAGMLAHAAVVFKNFSGWTTYSNELRDKAIAAWNNYQSSSNKAEICSNGGIKAGDGNGPGNQYANEHLAEAVCTAVYLFALTGDVTYGNFVKNNYQNSRPWNVGTSGTEWSFYRSNQGEALMFYTKLSNADQVTKDAILNLRKSATKSDGGDWFPQTSTLYRNKMVANNYGSNNITSVQSAEGMDMLVYNLRSADHAKYKEKSLAAINYMHGQNPLGICFLTNMYSQGGDLCADEMWHTWFDVNSKYDNVNAGCSKVGPAPGFLTGGINKNGSGELKVKIGATQFNALVKDQPVEKRFSNKNSTTSGACPAEESAYAYSTPWEYNEPGIYYQASYIRVLTHFVARYQADIPVSSVSVIPVTATRAAGLNQQCTATVSPANATNTAVTWSSDNTAVATVNVNGLVTTKTSGTARIIATTASGSKKDTCIVTVTPAPASTTCNLVTNTGFEANFVGWDITNNNGYASITTDKKTGVQACVITGTGSINRVNVISVNSGYELKMTAWAKIEGTPTAAQIGIDYRNDAGTELGQDYVDITATAYAEITTKKYPPVGTTKVLIWTYKSGGGKLFIDDVCLSQSDVCGLVENPGFETDFRSWNNANSVASIVTTGQNYGNKAASINNQGGLNRSANIPVPAGNKVNFSASAKIEGSPSTAMIGLDFINASGTKISNQVFNIISTAWTSVSYSQVPPTGTTQILIWTYKGSATGKLFIDDVCMTTTAATRVSAEPQIMPELNAETVKSIYPNPTEDILNVPVLDMTERTMEVEILDISGRTVILKTFQTLDNQTTVEVNVSKLLTGSYLVKSKQGLKANVQKMVKK